DILSHNRGESGPTAPVSALVAASAGSFINGDADMPDTMAIERNELLGSDGLSAYAHDGFYVARGLIAASEIETICTAFMEEGKNGPVEGLSEFKHSGIAAYGLDDPLRFYPRMMFPHR